jgi:hypothetical protein
MSDRILVATRKGLFDLRRDAKGAWTLARESFLGSPVSMVLRDARDGTLYAALDLGHFGAKLHRSDDDGASWTELATPSYAGLEGDLSLQRIWALEASGADEPGVLWAGTVPGGLFRSEDRGASWSINRPLWDRPERAQMMGAGNDQPVIHSICVDPRSSKRIALAISTGGVWFTADGGASWTPGGEGLYSDYTPPGETENLSLQDVHRLVQCRAAPDNFWLQHHNGIFRSSDGLKTTPEIKTCKPSKFGFAVAVHPADPETAWFVPAQKDEFRYPVDGKFVVSRTKDGGRSFEILSAGLPDGPAYDLVYRHGLDVDARGERLAMASTTGNLWISESAGEAWQLFSAHLPPVYAVRFA